MIGVGRRGTGWLPLKGARGQRRRWTSRTGLPAEIMNCYRVRSLQNLQKLQNIGILESSEFPESSESLKP